ncbi:MAG: hypothetical protein DI539_24145 [Flavobacterium psychrophilum]|nr:MAG: hypothetical protein DI539_24145 [Flavobacterium psychrophilum]
MSLDFIHGYRLIRSPKIKIPHDIEVPVFLIIHELQSRMLFKHLGAVGFQGCYFENFLDRLILASLDMWDGTDETFKIYFDLIEKWSEDINANDDVIIRRALKIYYALVKARDKSYTDVKYLMTSPSKTKAKKRKK